MQKAIDRAKDMLVDDTGMLEIICQLEGYILALSDVIKKQQ